LLIGTVNKIVKILHEEDCELFVRIRIRKDLRFRSRLKSGEVRGCFKRR